VDEVWGCPQDGEGSEPKEAAVEEQASFDDVPSENNTDSESEGIVCDQKLKRLGCSPRPAFLNRKRPAKHTKKRKRPE